MNTDYRISVSLPNHHKTAKLIRRIGKDGMWSLIKGKDGQQQKEVEYLNIEVWGKTAENCAQYLRKGSEAFVEGRIKTDSYEKDGQKKSCVKIVADSVQFGSRPRIEGERPAGGDEHPQFDGDGDVPF